VLAQRPVRSRVDVADFGCPTCHDSDRTIRQLSGAVTGSPSRILDHFDRSRRAALLGASREFT
jgi:hypothetical protein